MTALDTVKTVALMWKRLPDVDDVEPIGEQDAIIFKEIKEVLERHSALNRFGINLLHRHFDLQENECILETTDLASRRQVIEVTDAAVLQTGRIIETQWAFDESGVVLCRGFCHYDRGHPHRHQQV